MSSRTEISRRTVLHGLGTAVALPMLDAMAPLARAAQTDKTQPVRLAFIFVPNGKNMSDWTPKAEGGDFELPAILEPLASVKDSINVLSGLDQDEGRAKGDGPGDHARAAATFLTGVHPYKTGGAKIRAGISVDQLAAQRIGKQTRFPSLELGCERGRKAGICDSGYSCAYSHNISWYSEFTPMAKETNPRAVYERLFASGSDGPKTTEQVRRIRYQKSILDYVLDDASRLRPRLGQNDRRKLDEYFTTIREIELRLARFDFDDSPTDPLVHEDDIPIDVPGDFTEHVRLMYDMMALAFQADLTRVASFMVANAGSNRSYKYLEVPEGHHSLSHHGNDEEKLRKISIINRFHVEHFARFLERLRATPDGESTLLDNVAITYGSGLADGNRHEHHGLPIVLAGRAGGTITTGRHIRYPKATPMNNLFLSLLDRVGASTESLGDSNGSLPHLDA